MLIGELAKRAGLKVQTIRFYERLKLLPEPQRKTSGYRIYAERDLMRLAFIRKAKVLGFSLAEIREILIMRERGRCPCGEVVSMAERHLNHIEKQLRNLTRFHDDLRQAIQDWKNSGQQILLADSICTLIERAVKLSQTTSHGDTVSKGIDSPVR